MKKLFTILAISALVAVPVTAYAAQKLAAKKSAPKVAKSAAKTTSKAQGKSKVDFNCTDFSSWQAAQDTFLKAGGVGKDIYDLDRDHDGIACEDLKK